MSEQEGGGAIPRRPFRLFVRGECTRGVETLKSHHEANRGRPRIEPLSKRGRLAVVGGGPLVLNDLDTLKSWDGDIWAINYTAAWLRGHGIESVMFTVDPLPFDPRFDKAIVASTCHPELIGSVAQVECFDALSDEGFSKIAGGSFSASCACLVALHMGYTEISWFGCEGNFQDTDHVDRHEAYQELVIVRAGGEEYLTEPSYLIQCGELLQFFARFPDLCKNRSHGLLEAMQRHPDTWEVVAVSAALKAKLNAHNGDTGLFDTPYRSAA